MAVEKLPSPDDRRYYVYAMLCRDRDSDTGYVKFGYSGSVTKRLYALRTSCPIPARFFAVSEVGRFKNIARRLEQALHTEFQDRKISGEWFRFDFNDRGEKDAFNQGCLRAFQRILGGNHEWWTKISVSAVDRFAQATRQEFIHNPRRKQMERRRNRMEQNKRDMNELEAYRVG